MPFITFHNVFDWCLTTHRRHKDHVGSSSDKKLQYAMFSLYREKKDHWGTCLMASEMEPEPEPEPEPTSWIWFYGFSDPWPTWDNLSSLSMDCIYYPFFLLQLLTEAFIKKMCSFIRSYGHTKYIFDELSDALFLLYNLTTFSPKSLFKYNPS